ncbi:MAG: hypothetical protein EOP89_01425 [Lysobacteraceae bacterium]|nr:MAG: hypothetical protein EOP89_01425 [Xanthomonadaceae bacterium]
MKQRHYTPAEWVAIQFDGVKFLAIDLSLTYATVWHWVNRGGGRIPSKHHLSILELAVERGLDVNCDDLVIGRTE